MSKKRKTVNFVGTALVTIGVLTLVMKTMDETDSDSPAVDAARQIMGMALTLVVLDKGGNALEKITSRVSKWRSRKAVKPLEK